MAMDNGWWNLSLNFLALKSNEITIFEANPNAKHKFIILNATA